MCKIGETLIKLCYVMFMQNTAVCVSLKKITKTSENKSLEQTVKNTEKKVVNAIVEGKNNKRIPGRAIKSEVI